LRVSKADCKSALRQNENCCDLPAMLGEKPITAIN
jgi:hypothetical protein